ncbi:MAG: hypothetical protein K8F92_07090 [Hyphomicrobium sp.]|uniref:hypothetical protein n=1 Tax=Hyphomicrobium sp. TaxID=82 RepID=UPI0025B7AF9F|nr:hypothetical protein [Hyphomicrobium sp.]MBZ0209402.1 hypothetical protein [Hyphomicrobium sp.]
MKSKNENTKKSQAQSFIDKARELGADDAESTNEVMRRLAQQPKAERKPLKKKKAAK